MKNSTGTILNVRISYKAKVKLASLVDELNGGNTGKGKITISDVVKQSIKERLGIDCDEYDE